MARPRQPVHHRIENGCGLQNILIEWKFILQIQTNKFHGSKVDKSASVFLKFSISLI